MQKLNAARIILAALATISLTACGAITIEGSSGTAAGGAVSSRFENKTGGSVTVGTHALLNVDTLTGNDFLNDGGTVDIQKAGFGARFKQLCSDTG